MNRPVFSMLHGFLGAPDFWRGAQQAIEAAFPAAMCMAPVLPGHGESPNSTFTAAQPATFDDAVRWYADTLRPIAPCFGIGYSMGARLMLGAALAFPHLFTGLILISVHPGIADTAERQSRQRWEHQLISLLNAESMVPLVDFFETLPVFHTQRSLPQTILTAQRQTRLSHSSSGIIVALQSLGLGRTPDLSRHLGKHRIPTQLITGELDKKYTQIARDLSTDHHVISHAVIPNAGHNILLETPEPAIKEMLAFIRQQLSAS